MRTVPHVDWRAGWTVGFLVQGWDAGQRRWTKDVDVEGKYLVRLLQYCCCHEHKECKTPENSMHKPVEHDQGQDSLSSKVQILIQPVSGHPFGVFVDAAEDVQSIKTAIQETKGYPCVQQHIVMSTSESPLQNDVNVHTLFQDNIERMLYLILDDARSKFNPVRICMHLCMHLCYFLTTETLLQYSPDRKEVFFHHYRLSAFWRRHVHQHPHYPRTM